MIIVAVFLDNIDREQTSEFRGNREPFCHTFLATFRLLKDWRLLTLIPLTMYSGFEQSFLSGEYTKVRRCPSMLLQNGTCSSLLPNTPYRVCVFIGQHLGLHVCMCMFAKSNKASEFKH